MRTIGVAADHAGFTLKEALAAAIRESGCQIVDFGAPSLIAGDDYPDYVVPLARAVVNGDVERGIVLCGSGVGACVAANKVAGVRAAICHDTYSAHQGVEHDDMNVLVLGARIIGASLAYELVDAFLRAKFISNEERFTRRFKKVLAIEAKYQKNSGQ